MTCAEISQLHFRTVTVVDSYEEWFKVPLYMKIITIA